MIDGENQRIGKQVNGTLVQGFLYENQLEPVAELDGAGNLVARFVYCGCGVGNIPQYLVKGGVTYRIIADHLGSPRLVVDSTTGAVMQRMDYDEFGKRGQACILTYSLIPIDFPSASFAPAPGTLSSLASLEGNNLIVYPATTGLVQEKKGN